VVGDYIGDLEMVDKPDFEKDGLCMANSPQQKTCKNYKKCTDSIYEFCKWQGLGTCCEYEEGNDG
jgi:hypothetical protein